MGKKGDCFETNTKKFIEMCKFSKEITQKIFLCHGKVIGAKNTPIEGTVYSHCWIEMNGDIYMDYSNGLNVVTHKDIVKDNIKEDTVVKYNIKTLFTKMIETENYGPWEQHLIEGL